MSMRENYVFDYGMVLNEEQIKMIAKRIIPEEEWISGEWEDAVPWEYAEAIEDIVVSYGEFSGEAYELSSDGYVHNFEKDYLSGKDSLFYIPVNRFPTLFKTSYKDLEDAKSEISEKIHNAFPVILHAITGSYYG